MGADVAGDARQRVAPEDDFQGTVNLALGNEPGVLGHVLADGTLLGTGRGDAVKERQLRCDLGQVEGEVALFVAATLKRLGCGGFERREPVLGQLVQAGRPPHLHLGLQVVQPLDQTRVAAWLEQVGGGGDRPGAAGHYRRQVQGVGPSGVGNIELAVELLHQLVEQVHGDGVEGAARHVHLLAGQRVLVVGHGQRVA